LELEHVINENVDIPGVAKSPQVVVPLKFVDGVNGRRRKKCPKAILEVMPG
jgi:hypothetical protein